MFPDKDATLKPEKEEWTLPSKDFLEAAISNRKDNNCFGGISVVSTMLHR